MPRSLGAPAFGTCFWAIYTERCTLFTPHLFAVLQARGICTNLEVSPIVPGISQRRAVVETEGYRPQDVWKLSKGAIGCSLLDRETRNPMIYHNWLVVLEHFFIFHKILNNPN